MTTPATRLITLIQLLQRRPNQKAGALADELGVSVRTLHRYFARLDELGIPVYAERGRHGGFALVRGYRMPPLVFTPAEAAALSLGAGLVEELWGSLYREAARAALAKLDNVLPEAQRRETAWARRSLAATRLHRADPDRLAPILDRLRQAVYARRRVRMLYQTGGSAAPAWRELDPYALVFSSGWWYTAGYCHQRQAVRTFRLDRIQELALAEATFEVPPDFDVRAYLESEYGGAPLLRARLRFAPEGVPLARSSRALWETLEEQPDGSALGTLLAPDLPWLASTVLSFGPLLEVLDPPELRRMVAEWAQAALELYRD